LGIADGVGGWSEVGVDPSQFAWELMNKCQINCQNMGIVNELEPLSILDNSYKQLKNERKVKAGSSTACLAVIDSETSILSSINLGDSGYVVIRNGKSVYQAKETTHYFNAPYQLSIIPPELNKGNHILNQPKDGLLAKIQLEHGDLIVFGTDGLFDNLFLNDIEMEIKVNEPDNLNQLLLASKKNQDLLKGYTNKVAGSLVKKARLRAKDKNKDSPFSKEAEKHGYRFKGGKMDDITVVVALVTKKSKLAQL
ncbi:protein serine/threonine phosphatase 2C, partial [Neoconidiobolus thromboides FSU 785]